MAETASFDLVLFLWARRKLIIGITLFGLIAGVVVAFLITPLYSSEVIMFPAVTNSVSKVQWPWQRVIGVSETAQHIVLRCSTLGAGGFVPKRAFTPEQQKRFLSYARKATI